MAIPKLLQRVLRRKAHTDHPVETDLEVWAAAEKQTIDNAVQALGAGAGPTEEWLDALDRRITAADDGIDIELDRWATFWRRETDAVVRRLEAEGPTEEWLDALDRRINGGAVADDAVADGCHLALSSGDGLAALDTYLSLVASLEHSWVLGCALTPNTKMAIRGASRRTRPSKASGRLSVADTGSGPIQLTPGRRQGRRGGLLNGSSRLVVGTVAGSVVAVSVPIVLLVFGKRPTRSG